jgi:hypothetical protein
MARVLDMLERHNRAVNPESSSLFFDAPAFIETFYVAASNQDHARKACHGRQLRQTTLRPSAAQQHRSPYELANIKLMVTCQTLQLRVHRNVNSQPKSAELQALHEILPVGHASSLLALYEHEDPCRKNAVCRSLVCYLTLHQSAHHRTIFITLSYVFSRHVRQMDCSSLFSLLYTNKLPYYSFLRRLRLICMEYRCPPNALQTSDIYL